METTTGKRRSQRLFLQVRVVVEAKLANKPFSEETHTIVVNAHGALEFSKPNPGFWRISFPPDDWTNKSPEAKKFR
jgi:hypothetical protein